MKRLNINRLYAQSSGNSAVSIRFFSESLTPFTKGNEILTSHFFNHKLGIFKYELIGNSAPFHMLYRIHMLNIQKNEVNIFQDFSTASGWANPLVSRAV